MRTTILVVAAIIAVFALLSLRATPIAPPEMTEAEIAQIEAEVMALMQEFVDGFNELDMAMATATFHPDHTTLTIGGEIVNKSGYREILDGWVGDKESWQGSWLETNVRVLSPSAAVFTGTWSPTIRYSNGSVRNYPLGAWVTLVERTAAGWRISAALGSNSGYEEVEGG